MKCKILAILLISSLIVFGCIGNQNTEPESPINETPELPINETPELPINETNENGIVYGTIGIYEGNCMPSPDRESCKPDPMQTTVYITQISEEFNEALLVTSATTNENGYFEIELPPGTYSLFINDGGTFGCRYVNCQERNCGCQFTIEKGKRTQVNTTLDHAAW